MGDDEYRSREAWIEKGQSLMVELERGNPAVVERIMALLSDGPMKPAALRAAVGIKSRIHFNRYYLAPMLEKGLVARTAPEHPNSPHQEYER